MAYQNFLKSTQHPQLVWTAVSNINNGLVYTSETVNNFYAIVSKDGLYHAVTRLKDCMDYKNYYPDLTWIASAKFDTLEEAKSFCQGHYEGILFTILPPKEKHIKEDNRPVLTDFNKKLNSLLEAIKNEYEVKEVSITQDTEADGFEIDDLGKKWEKLKQVGDVIIQFAIEPPK